MDGQVFLVAGLAYGDEGKGATVDYLVRKHGLGVVVRYNGGCQAAHNVVLEDGRHHTFSQFGSGMLVPGCQTYLSQYMLINPVSMLNEAKHLAELGVADALANTWVHVDALIVTPFHRAANRLIEWSRGDRAHGSCGLGIGMTRALHLTRKISLSVRHLLGAHETARPRLQAIKDACFLAARGAKYLPRTEADIQEMSILTSDSIIAYLAEVYKDWASRVVTVWSDPLRNWLQKGTGVVFEGAQGLLLDESLGQPPHNTWTDTTFGNADKILCDANYSGNPIRIGCLRTYMTRHGAGPFDTESNTLKKSLPEPHNSDDSFQGKFRVGYMNFPFIKWAASQLRIDEIALSHMDYLPLLGYKDSESYIMSMMRNIGVPVNIIGRGPTAKDRSELGYGRREDRGESAGSGDKDIQPRLPFGAEREVGVG
jgi:adenylosuccinate synthase